MNYQQTTQVPNKVLDRFLPTLTGAEFKLLMIIIRQTFGWRKQRDRMNYTQLIQRTGLSRRVIADGIQSLINKELITATDYYQNSLHTPELRQGKTSIFFSSTAFQGAENTVKKCSLQQKQVHNSVDNKTNSTKLIQQKDLFNQGSKIISDAERIAQIRMLKTLNERKGSMND